MTERRRALRRRASRSTAALCGLGLTALVALSPSVADAFCGFYVGGADTKLFNNATMVVMMRDGTRTVLSMQNNYEGPPENFALVVPVPTVLQKENVQTLPREIFQRIDQLAAPRLVEYWEQDPCRQEEETGRRAKGEAAAAPQAMASAAAEDRGVKIEAQFTVGEYEIVILSANDSSGLEKWLHDNNYKIPDGAGPVLKPYVEANMKFFVAKVDPKKVKFEKRDGKDMAMLSPLRFYYDTDTFSLPVRLGLLNSNGKQDLIVHILARNKRYEVANYPNVTIPTNIDVAESTRNEFGSFYAALFDKTLESLPTGVITEYSWGANNCDPCPTPGLTPSELATFGADSIGTSAGADGPRQPQVTVKPVEGEPTAQAAAMQSQGTIQGCYMRALQTDPKVAGQITFHVETDASGDVTADKATGDLPATLLTCARGAIDTLRFTSINKRKFEIGVDLKSVPVAPPIPYDFVLTRLHARYGKESLAQDLIFREAKAIVGGREIYDGTKRLEMTASDASSNNFQARYAIRHPWKGAISCSHPVRGVWGGPPGNEPNLGVKPALDLAFAQRGNIELTKFLKQDVPELKITGLGPGGLAGLLSQTKDHSSKSDDSSSDTPHPSTSACSCDVGASDGTAPFAAFVAAALAGLTRRRKPSSR